MSFLQSRAFTRIVLVLFIVAVPLFLVTTNVRIVINSGWLYEMDAANFKTLENTGMERGDFIQATKEIKHYFNSSEEPLNVRAVVYGQEQYLFTEREIRHMADVKTLVRWLGVAQFGSLMYMVAVLIFGRFAWGMRALWPRVAKSLFRGSILTLVGLVVIGLAALIGFDAAFTAFHNIFFRNDYWKLDNYNYLLLMFPEAFFFVTTMILAGLIVTQASLTALFAKLYLRRWKKAVLNPEQS